MTDVNSQLSPLDGMALESAEEQFPRSRRKSARTGKKLMEKEPTLPSRKEEKAGFLGLHYRGDPLEYVSDKQRELKKDLERELEKLKQREYPGYA